MKRFISFKFSLLFSAMALFVASCTVFDPPVVVPAYGHIDSVHFTTFYDTQGTASATIPTAWVYLDDNPVGAFQLPSTFPMVASNGVHNIKIYPGISAGDASSAYNINPFYQYYSFNVNLQQGVTTTFKPTSTYYDWVIFKLMEDFDLPSETTNLIPAHIKDYGGGGVKGAGSTTYMQVISGPKVDVYQGGHSGMVVVTKAKPYYIGMTDPYLSLPTGSTPVYMEANYKATTLVSIGMFESDTVTQISPIIIYPTSTWSKFYYDMSTTISQFQVNTSSYRVYFSMVLDSVDGHTSDTLLLDNIKIMY